jgi:hypothetical protein
MTATKSTKQLYEEGRRDFGLTQNQSEDEPTLDMDMDMDITEPQPAPRKAAAPKRKGRKAPKRKTAAAKRKTAASPEAKQPEQEEQQKEQPEQPEQPEQEEQEEQEEEQEGQESRKRARSPDTETYEGAPEEQEQPPKKKKRMPPKVTKNPVHISLEKRKPATEGFRDRQDAEAARGRVLDFFGFASHEEAKESVQDPVTVFSHYTDPSYAPSLLEYEVFMTKRRVAKACVTDYNKVERELRKFKTPEQLEAEKRKRQERKKVRQQKEATINRYARKAGLSAQEKQRMWIQSIRDKLPEEELEEFQKEIGNVLSSSHSNSNSNSEDEAAPSDSEPDSDHEDTPTTNLYDFQ